MAIREFETREQWVWGLTRRRSASPLRFWWGYDWWSYDWWSCGRWWWCYRWFVGLVGGTGLCILPGRRQMRDGLPTTLGDWEGLFQQSPFTIGVCDIACTWRYLTQGLHCVAISRAKRPRLPMDGGSEGAGLFDGVLPSYRQISVVHELRGVILLNHELLWPTFCC